jgi:hypothetical protein
MADQTPWTDARDDLRRRSEPDAPRMDGDVTHCEWCGAEYPVPEGARGLGRSGHPRTPAPSRATADANGPMPRPPAALAAADDERGDDMDMQELIRRTAWQAGTTEDEAGRLVEAFLHEVRAAVAEA